MRSALFVVKFPKDDEVWRDFLKKADQFVRAGPGTLRLAENVWLVNLAKSTAPLGYLIAYADGFELSYGILPFEREPEWLPADFDPKPTPDRSEQP